MNLDLSFLNGVYQYTPPADRSTTTAADISAPDGINLTVVDISTYFDTTYVTATIPVPAANALPAGYYTRAGESFFGIGFEGYNYTASYVDSDGATFRPRSTFIDNVWTSYDAWGRFNGSAHIRIRFNFRPSGSNNRVTISESTFDDFSYLTADQAREYVQDVVKKTFYAPLQQRIGDAGTTSRHPNYSVRPVTDNDFVLTDVRNNWSRENHQIWVTETVLTKPDGTTQTISTPEGFVATELRFSTDVNPGDTIQFSVDDFWPTLPVLTCMLPDNNLLDNNDWYVVRIENFSQVNPSSASGVTIEVTAPTLTNQQMADHLGVDVSTIASVSGSSGSASFSGIVTYEVAGMTLKASGSARPTPQNLDLPVTAAYYAFPDLYGAGDISIRGSYRVRYTTDRPQDYTVVNITHSIPRIISRPTKTSADITTVRNHLSNFGSTATVVNSAGNPITFNTDVQRIHNTRVSAGVVTTVQVNIDIVPATVPNTPAAGVVVRFYDAISSGPASRVSPTSPSAPVSGDLWFDTSDNTFKVWTGSAWVATASSITAATAALDNAGKIEVRQNIEVAKRPEVGTTAPQSPLEGDMWFNPTTGELKIYMETE